MLRYVLGFLKWIPITVVPEVRNSANAFKSVIAKAERGDIEGIKTEYPGVFLRFKTNILSTVQFRTDELNSSCGVWICGPPSCGKDCSVHKLGSVYCKMLNKWWDGYDNEKNVLLPDVEPEHGSDYLETIQAKYFRKAKAKGIYIVESCGFDSIPSDYGISLLKQKFPGELNSVETFIEIGAGSEGRCLNIGTWISIIYTISDVINTKQFDDSLKEELVFTKNLAQSNYPLRKRFPPLFYSSEVSGWCWWYAGPNDRIRRRTQMFRYEYLNERPIQSNEYIKMSSLFMALWNLAFSVISIFFSTFSAGRYLLIRYPEVFSGGLFTSTGPTRQQVLEGSTKFTLHGKGWEEKSEKPTDLHDFEPLKEMKLTITGPEPFYVLSTMCMVQAGLVILQEIDKLPLGGGVFTPGVAFENTTLRERLEKRGMTFEFEDIE